MKRGTVGSERRTSNCKSLLQLAMRAIPRCRACERSRKIRRRILRAARLKHTSVRAACSLTDQSDDRSERRSGVIMTLVLTLMSLQQPHSAMGTRPAGIWGRGGRGLMEMWGGGNRRETKWRKETEIRIRIWAKKRFENGPLFCCF